MNVYSCTSLTILDNSLNSGVASNLVYLIEEMCSFSSLKSSQSSLVQCRQIPVPMPVQRVVTEVQGSRSAFKELGQNQCKVTGQGQGVRSCIRLFY